MIFVSAPSGSESPPMPDDWSMVAFRRSLAAFAPATVGSRESPGSLSSSAWTSSSGGSSMLWISGCSLISPSSLSASCPLALIPGGRRPETWPGLAQAVDGERQQQGEEVEEPVRDDAGPEAPEPFRHDALDDPHRRDDDEDRDVAEAVRRAQVQRPEDQLLGDNGARGTGNGHQGSQQEAPEEQLLDEGRPDDHHQDDGDQDRGVLPGTPQGGHVAPDETPVDHHQGDEQDEAGKAGDEGDDQAPTDVLATEPQPEVTPDVAGPELLAGEPRRAHEARPQPGLAKDQRKETAVGEHQRSDKGAEEGKNHRGGDAAECDAGGARGQLGPGVGFLAGRPRRGQRRREVLADVRPVRDAAGPPRAIPEPVLVPATRITVPTRRAALRGR